MGDGIVTRKAQSESAPGQDQNGTVLSLSTGSTLDLGLRVTRRTSDLRTRVAADSLEARSIDEDPIT